MAFSFKGLIKAVGGMFSRKSAPPPPAPTYYPEVDTAKVRYVDLATKAAPEQPATPPADVKAQSAREKELKQAGAPVRRAPPPLILQQPVLAAHAHGRRRQKRRASQNAVHTRGEAMIMTRRHEMIWSRP